VGNTPVGKNDAIDEQDFINSLYRMFKITSAGSKSLEDFESMMGKPPAIKSKQPDNSNLKDELDNIIKCLEYFEHFHATIDVSVKNVFLVLEKTIKDINPLNFEAEMFDAFNTIINKLVIYSSQKKSLENRKEWQDLILKYGELIALIHNVVITKLMNLSQSLSKRLEANEKENAHINNKILDLEEHSKQQTRAIAEVVATVKSLPVKQKEQKEQTN
jgi:hypothetical protein